MNKLISLIAINLVSFRLIAQTVNDVPIKDIDVEYVQIVGAAKFLAQKWSLELILGKERNF